MPSISPNSLPEGVNSSGLLIASSVSDLAAATAIQVINVVSRNDVERAGEGDVFVSRSGTRRKVVEKLGPTQFIVESEKEYQGCNAVNYVFSLEYRGELLDWETVFGLEKGSTIYGTGGDFPMVVQEVLGLDEGHPYGIIVKFREELSIDMDTDGKWLKSIEKKA